MSIPQVLGYTRIARMPVATGLYTAVLPVLAFALFGALRQRLQAQFVDTEGRPHAVEVQQRLDMALGPPR